MRSAVDRGEIEVLRYIASRANNIRIQTKILATAIAYDDRKAVQVLLDAGVDPTADLVSASTLRRKPYISVVAEAMKFGMAPFRNVPLSQAIMDHLLKQGFEFKVGKHH